MQEWFFFLFNKKQQFRSIITQFINKNLFFFFKGRAKQLYKAGFKTWQIIAKADPQFLQEKIDYLSNRVARQIVSAAKVKYYHLKTLFLTF